jgi:predicted nucleotidyltransferase component of viral defense system
MINKEQVDELSKFFQIDGFTIMREYLQLMFLSYLYREKEAASIYFKGGTAIRLLFDSPRFSEDLDFSTKLSKNEIKKIMQRLEKTMQKELTRLKIILLYSGKKGIRFRLKYQSIDFKYPLVIRLDFNLITKSPKVSISPIITRFPIIIFPLVFHLSNREILAEKIAALVTRAMGRDFFDVWYLLEKGIAIDWKLIDKKSVLKKIRQIHQKKLQLDLAKFLPKSQRNIIEILPDELIKNLG